MDISPELRKRVRMAAAREDISVREYVESILEAAVPNIFEGTVIASGTSERLRHLRERLMRGRKRFETDSVDILEEARRKRSEEFS